MSSGSEGGSGGGLILIVIVIIFIIFFLTNQSSPSPVVTKTVQNSRIPDLPLLPTRIENSSETSYRPRPKETNPSPVDQTPRRKPSISLPQPPITTSTSPKTKSFDKNKGVFENTSNIKPISLDPLDVYFPIEDDKIEYKNDIIVNKTTFYNIVNIFKDRNYESDNFKVVYDVIYKSILLTKNRSIIDDEYQKFAKKFNDMNKIVFLTEKYVNTKTRDAMESPFKKLIRRKYDGFINDLFKSHNLDATSPNLLNDSYFSGLEVSIYKGILNYEKFIYSSLKNEKFDLRVLFPNPKDYSLDHLWAHCINLSVTPDQSYSDCKILILAFLYLQQELNIYVECLYLGQDLLQLLRLTCLRFFQFISLILHHFTCPSDSKNLCCHDYVTHNEWYAKIFSKITHSVLYIVLFIGLIEKNITMVPECLNVLFCILFRNEDQCERVFQYLTEYKNSKNFIRIKSLLVGKELVRFFLKKKYYIYMFNDSNNYSFSIFKHISLPLFETMRFIHYWGARYSNLPKKGFNYIKSFDSFKVFFSTEGNEFHFWYIIRHIENEKGIFLINDLLHPLPHFIDKFDYKENVGFGGTLSKIGIIECSVDESVLFLVTSTNNCAMCSFDRNIVSRNQMVKHVVSYQNFIVPIKSLKSEIFVISLLLDFRLNNFIFYQNFVIFSTKRYNNEEVSKIFKASLHPFKIDKLSNYQHLMNLEFLLNDSKISTTLVNTRRFYKYSIVSETNNFKNTSEPQIICIKFNKVRLFFKFYVEYYSYLSDNDRFKKSIIPTDKSKTTPDYSVVTIIFGVSSNGVVDLQVIHNHEKFTTFKTFIFACYQNEYQFNEAPVFVNILNLENNIEFNDKIDYSEKFYDTTMMFKKKFIEKKINTF